MNIPDEHASSHSNLSFPLDDMNLCIIGMVGSQ